MKKQVLILTVILSAFFASCSSDGTKENSSEATGNPMSQKSPGIDFEGTDYVKIGEQHNEKMLEFFSYYCNDNLSKKEAFLKLDFGIDKEKQAEYFNNIQSLSLEEKSKRLRAQLTTGLSKQLFDAIGEEINTSENYNELIIKINAKIVIIKANLKNEEYGILMGYAEVAKHSAYLWFPSEMGGSGMGKCYYDKEFPNGEPNGYAAFARTRTQSDGLGAGFGMVGWALSVGIWGGPVTLVPLLASFAFAAVYGAVTGSV